MTDTETGMDLIALRDGVRGVLAEQASHERVKAFADAEQILDKALWDQAAGLGWTALSAPECFGGLGLGALELGVVQQELGRAVAPLPWLGTMLAVEILSHAGEGPQVAAWTEGLATGTRIGAVSMVTPEALSTDLILSSGAGGLVLNGFAGDLMDGSAADLLILLARREDGKLAWVVVEPSIDGVTPEKIATVDRTRHLAQVRFTDVSLPSERLLAVDAERVGQALLATASLAIAADCDGGANAILELTLDYLKTRQQFGKPIGSFQALKHRCAEHKIALVASGGLLAEATDRLARGDDEALRLALAAKALCASVYFRIAEDAVQLHGGIGYTWEHPCHLYLKRARLNQQLFGGETAHLDRVAQLLLAAA